MADQITIYIEDTEIKVLVTKGKSTDKWASLLLEPGLVNDGVIIEEEQVAEKIKELFHLQNISGKGVTVALSGLHSAFRILTLPQLPQAILHEAVNNEASRAIPFSLDQVYLKYQVIPSSPEETKVFLVAYPRNATNALVRTIKKAGLTIISMDLAPLALCRCANVPRAIIVNNWLSNVDIAIIVDRIPQVIRSISLPTEAISFEDKLPSIAEEFNRTVAFYNSSQPDNKLDEKVPVFVCGDLGREPKSWPILIGEHGYNVSELLAPLDTPESFNSSPFMVNVGLALKESFISTKEGDYSIININTIPEVYKPKKTSPFNILAPVFIIILLAGLVYGWFYVQNLQKETDDLQSQLTDVQLEITQQNPKITALTDQVNQLGASIQPVKDTADKLETLLFNLRRDRIDIVEDLKKAVDLQPSSVYLYLTSLSHDGDFFTVSGNARHEDDIFQYARELRRTELFSEIIISSINQVEIVSEEEGGASEVAYHFELIVT